MSRGLGHGLVFIIMLGTGAACEAPPETLTDSPELAGIDPSGDWRDTDGDSLSDGVEGGEDWDWDGLPDYLDLDSDDDCVPDLLEAGLHGPTGDPMDTDGDSVADFRDVDSDGDGVGEWEEDFDCDGILDPGETSPRDVRASHAILPTGPAPRRRRGVAPGATPGNTRWVVPTDSEQFAANVARCDGGTKPAYAVEAGRAS